MQYIGTSHFVSRAAAIKYYLPYGTDSKAVDQKIAEGEIHIGPPKLEPGDRLTVIPDEGRYQIERRDKMRVKPSESLNPVKAARQLRRCKQIECLDRGAFTYYTSIKLHMVMQGDPADKLAEVIACYLPVPEDRPDPETQDERCRRLVLEMLWEPLKKMPGNRDRVQLPPRWGTKTKEGLYLSLRRIFLEGGPDEI